MRTKQFYLLIFLLICAIDVFAMQADSQPSTIGKNYRGEPVIGSFEHESGRYLITEISGKATVIRRWDGHAYEQVFAGNFSDFEIIFSADSVYFFYEVGRRMKGFIEGPPMRRPIYDFYAREQGFKEKANGSLEKFIDGEVPFDHKLAHERWRSHGATDGIAVKYSISKGCRILEPFRLEGR